MIQKVKVVGISVVVASMQLSCERPSEKHKTISPTSRRIQSIHFAQPNIRLNEGSSTELAVKLGEVSDQTANIRLSLQPVRVQDRHHTLSRLAFLSSEVTIPAGELSAKFVLSSASDSTYQGVVPVVVTAVEQSGGAQAEARIELLDDEAPTLTGGDVVSADESGGVDFTVTLTQPTVAINRPVHVSYQTTDWTAKAGLDYVSTSGSITFQPGETSKTVTVQRINDSLPEPTRAFDLQLKSEEAVVTNSARAILYDDELAAEFQIASTQNSKTNANSVQFNLRFSQPILIGSFFRTSIVNLGTATCSGASLTPGSADPVIQEFLVVSINCSADGTVIPSLASGEAVTPYGIWNEASILNARVEIDTSRPTVTIDQAVNQIDPTLALPVEYSMVFSEPIDSTELTPQSINQAGTASGVTWSITDSGDHRHFVIRALTAGGFGTIQPTLADNSVSDLFGNLNLASTSTDNRVSYGIVVLAAYENAPAWNDKIRFDGSNVYTASGILCDGSEATFTACLHSGEIKKVILPNESSCNGLSVADALGNFDWVCSSVSGSAVFFSTGLKPGKSLRDLISSDGLYWKPNSVTVTGGHGGSSSPVSWWPMNPVAVLPDNALPTQTVVNLTSSHTVYTLPTSRASSGYNLNASGQSLVTLNDAVLSYSGRSNNNVHLVTGKTSAAQRVAILGAGSVNNLWIEADLNGVPTTGTSALGFVFRTVKLSRVKNTRILDTSAPANLGLIASRIEKLEMFHYGLNITGASGNLMTSLRVMSAPGTASPGITLAGSSSGNIFDNLNISNSTSNGLSVQDGSVSNSFLNTVIVGSAATGIVVATPTTARNIFVNSLVVNANGEGVQTSGGNGNAFHNLVVTNSSNRAIDSIGATQTTFSQVALTHALYGVRNTAGNRYEKFSGLLLIGNMSTNACSISSSATGAGLSGTGCAPANLSTSYLTTTVSAGVSTENSFIGAMNIDDPANSSDAFGAATFPSSIATFDWFHFLNPLNSRINPFRTWIKDGSTFPDLSNRGNWSTGPGRIWDFRLASPDTVLRNRTANGSNANADIVEGAVCPTWLSGNDVIQDISSGEVMGNGNTFCEVGETCAGRTYLRNAFEVIDDRKGNDNGLCETGESCIASPNFGAYQGQGDFTTKSCVFQDGSAGNVTGVLMHFYPTN